MNAEPKPRYPYLTDISRLRRFEHIPTQRTHGRDRLKVLVSLLAIKHMGSGTLIGEREHE